MEDDCSHLTAVPVNVSSSVITSSCKQLTGNVTGAFVALNQVTSGSAEKKHIYERALREFAYLNLSSYSIIQSMLNP